MTLQIEKEKESFNWKKYVYNNWNVLYAHPFTRRMIDAIVSNDNFTVNVWSGVKGTGKSTLQRQYSYRIYGDWDLVYRFRVQTREELMQAIADAKSDALFHIKYHGWTMKRVPLLDIDDKGTIFPSSEANTKEVQRWHKWWQSIRTDVAVIMGSSPNMSDVRKRLRIGADSEVLAIKTLYPSGQKKFEAEFWELKYHSKFNDPEGVYVTKNKVCGLTWEQLPKEVLHRELNKREELADTLRRGVEDDPEVRAKALIKGELMESQKAALKLLDRCLAHKPFISTVKFNQIYCQEFSIERDPAIMSRVYTRLKDMGVIRYDLTQGGGMIELTVVGKEVCKVMKVHEGKR